METFQTVLARRLADALEKLGLPNTGELTPATDPRFGDYQTNVALVLGKQRGEPPRTLADKIVQVLEVADLCQVFTAIQPIVWKSGINAEAFLVVFLRVGHGPDYLFHKP